MTMHQSAQLLLKKQIYQIFRLRRPTTTFKRDYYNYDYNVSPVLPPLHYKSLHTRPSVTFHWSPPLFQTVTKLGTGSSINSLRISQKCYKTRRGFSIWKIISDHRKKRGGEGRGGRNPAPMIFLRFFQHLRPLSTQLIEN